MRPKGGPFLCVAFDILRQEMTWCREISLLSNKKTKHLFREDLKITPRNHLVYLKNTPLITHWYLGSLFTQARAQNAALEEGTESLTRNSHCRTRPSSGPSRNSHGTYGGDKKKDKNNEIPSRSRHSKALSAGAPKFLRKFSPLAPCPNKC